MKLDPTQAWPLALRSLRLASQTNASALVPSSPAAAASRVAFLKTHKCASTTVQNMLLRFARAHRLNPVIPKFGNYLSRKIPFDSSMALWHPTPPNGFHVVAHHMIWNKTAVEDLLGPNAVYFSVVRDPVDQFKSLFAYSGLESVYGQTLDEFSLSPNKTNVRFGGNVGRNQISFDFGLSPSLFDSRCATLRKISEIESTFDFIMVVEQFDESLVLLNEVLNWSWDDLAYVERNKLKEYSDLNSDAKDELRKWLGSDQLIYEYFDAKLKVTLATVRPEILRVGLASLGEARARIQTFCGFYDVSDAARLPMAERPYQYQKLKGVGVARHDNETCVDFVRSENSFFFCTDDDDWRNGCFRGNFWAILSRGERVFVHLTLPLFDRRHL